MDLTINLSEKECKVLMNKDGKIEEKNVDINDLTKSLISWSNFSSGILPRNTRYFAGNNNNNFAICLESVGRKRLFYTAEFSTKIYNIPFPSLLMFFLIQSNRVMKTQVFAIKDGIKEENTALYRFPFSNTWPDGRVCWNDTKLPNINKPMDVIGIVSLFYDSKYSAHLLDPYVVKTFKTEKGSVAGFHELLEYVKDKDKFPEEALYPMQYDLDFNRVIKNLEAGL